MLLKHVHSMEALLVIVTFVRLVIITGAADAVSTGPCRHQRQLSFMWRIKRKVPAYLFGTIHVPYTRVWDSVPHRIKDAFQSSDLVYFELDLLDPNTVSTLSDCQMLPHGKKLIDVLPIDMYRRLKRHLDYVRGALPTWMTSDQRGKGLYAEYLFNAITVNWERKRPVWVMLMVNSLTESDIRSRGVPVLDLYLAHEAQRMNKRTGAVERVEEQCQPLNGLNVTQVLFALNRTLLQHESIRRGLVSSPMTTDDLIQHYNCGNLNAVIFNQDTAQIPSLVKAPFEVSSSIQEDLQLANKIDDYFRSELILKRNKRMGQRVLELLAEQPERSFFFAFGAGHFLGNNSIVDFVEDGGFEVVRIGQIKSGNGCKQPVKTTNGSSRSCTLSAGSTKPRKRKTNSNARVETSSPTSKVSLAEALVPVAWRPSSHHQMNSPSISQQSSPPRTGDSSWSAGSSGGRIVFGRDSDLATFGASSTPYTSAGHSSSWGRGFNDLWVRLETATEKMPLFIRPREELATNDVQSVRKYVSSWHGLVTSAHEQATSGGRSSSLNSQRQQHQLNHQLLVSSLGALLISLARLVFIC